MWGSGKGQWLPVGGEPSMAGLAGQSGPHPTAPENHEEGSLGMGVRAIPEPRAHKSVVMRQV